MALYDIEGNEIPIPAAADAVDDGTFNTLLFSKCIFIGDSLTKGIGCTDFAAQSYPARMAKITGWEITNAGVGGASATSWLTDEYAKYTYADYQVAFVELATNKGLTDTLDADVNQFDTYDDYADTQTGNYCKLIEKLREDNPQMFIVLVISPNLVREVSAVYYTAADVILKIGEKYNLPVIDLRNIPEDLCNAKYSSNPGVVDVHQNAVGYTAKARAVYKRFCKIAVDRAAEIHAMFFAT